MLKLFINLQNRWADMQNQDGATAAEYGLFVALIAAVIVGVVRTLGTQIRTAFTTVTAAL